MDRFDVLPDGDIILAVSGSLELLVSSVALSMTSPVFKTMLGPHFAEGQALRHKSTEVPHVVTLPDDDAELMKALCLVSHRKYKAVQVPENEAFRATFIIDLVALADKYDCMAILRFPAASWLVAVNTQSLIRSTKVACAEAAFKLDDATFFGRCTRSLVLDGEVDLWALAEGVSACRESILDAVWKTENHTAKIVTEMIDDIVTSAGIRLSADYKHCMDVTRPKTTDCEYNTAAVGTLLRALCVAQLWPPSSRGRKLRDTIRNVQALEVPEVTLISPCGTCLDGGSENILGMFERDIGHAKNTVQEIFTAVCLDCLKQIGDGYSPCRTPHYGEWATNDGDGDGRLNYDFAKLGD
ncbi:hypothetical protein LTR56_013683 [Elasticomyces elasticus]|nr:hypothetical protein LTR56_013683 [Elasticomyces elasticus]KAK3668493.1 hypothetical protein LTR22_000787 [Elasticomyces elasticus]KAK4930817.1 hypothetical protein LTR49_002581 [Elasticomyces elasticus]KAK5748235.1 hypothetical protein LTS12_021698 [Elasticomyces elasticus]